MLNLSGLSLTILFMLRHLSVRVSIDFQRRALFSPLVLLGDTSEFSTSAI